MPSVQILNKITVCEDIGSLWNIFCLPPRINCFPGCRDQILSDCERTHNCTKKQGQESYFLPSMIGDKFQFETIFVDDFNVDNEVPAIGWGDASDSFMSAELCDENGIVSTDVNAFTSRKLVGWNGGRSYQIIEVDVSLIAGLISGKCWNVKVIAHNADGAVTDSLCTQDFIIEEDCISEECTVLIGSTMKSEDCCDNWYGDPVTYVGDLFTYDNTLRYRASINFVGGNNQKEVQRVGSSTKARRVEITEIYEILFKDAMPPFLAKQLLRVHLSGVSAEIDGETYYLDEFSIENALRCNFNFPVQVYRFCENKFSC